MVGYYGVVGLGIFLVRMSIGVGNRRLEVHRVELEVRHVYLMSGYWR